MNFYELLNEIVDKIARNYDLSSDEMLSLDFIRAKLIVVITIVSSLACSTLFLVYLLKVQSFNFSLGLILFGAIVLWTSFFVSLKLKKINLIIYTMLILGSLIIPWRTAITGGLQSGGLIWLYLTPLIATVFLSFRAGVLLFLFNSIFGLAMALGGWGIIPDFVDRSGTNIDIVSLTSGCLLLLMMAKGIEYSREKLTERLIKNQEALIASTSELEHISRVKGIKTIVDPTNKQIKEHLKGFTNLQGKSELSESDLKNLKRSLLEIQKISHQLVSDHKGPGS